MLIFLLKKYLANLFSTHKPLYCFGKILYLIFMLFQGILLGFGLDAIQEKHPEVITKILLSLNASIFVAIILRNTFPFYSSKNSIIPRYYAVSPTRRITADFLQDICSMMVLSMFLLVCGMLYGNIFKLTDFALSLGVILSTILIEGNFKNLLEKQFKQLFLHYVIFVLQIILVFLYLKIHILFVIIGFVLGIIQTYLLSKNEIENSKKQVFSKSTSNIFSLYLKLYFKNNKMRSMLIMAVVVKMFIIFTFSPKIGEAMLILITLYSTPLVFFTYIHMNWFGYNESLWLTLQNNSISNQKNKYLYLLPLIFPLVFDVALAFVVMYFSGKLDMKFASFYIASTIACVSIGYYASTEAPKKILSMTSMLFNMKIQSDILSVISLVILVAFMFFIMQTMFFYPFCLIVIFVSITYFILAKQENHITFKNFQTFFNSKE